MYADSEICSIFFTESEIILIWKPIHVVITATVANGAEVESTIYASFSLDIPSLSQISREVFPTISVFE